MFNFKRSGCEAYQVSDQMRCERCNLLWDINDEDKPDCLTGHELFQRAKETLHRVNES